jgi:AraC-like DNA-binding protein
MSTQGTSNRASSGKDVVSRPTNQAITAPSTAPTFFPTDEALLQQKFRELICKHLDKHIDALFSEFTGVHFHITWTPALPRRWDARTLPTGCSVCCRLTGSPLLPACRTCGPKQLARVLSADGEGYRFTCRLGVRNYWIPVRIRGETLGIAYLQALENSAARSGARQRSARAAHAPLRRDSATVLSPPKFARAARLLQLIVQHVQTASLNDLRKADLTSAGRAVLALEKEQARLHETLQRYLPPSPPAPRHSGPESHADQVMNRLLERIKLDYRKPITLQQYARELGMNAAYLSDLFSRAVGVPFKTYLTELRLAKARELLADPARTAAEVAYSIGYSSENRFRIAFKKAIGLSPSIWRETFRIAQPVLLSWFFGQMGFLESLGALVLI